MADGLFFDKNPDPVRVIRADYVVMRQNQTAKRLYGPLDQRRCYESAFGLSSPCNGCLLAQASVSAEPQSGYIIDDRSKQTKYDQVTLIPFTKHSSAEDGMFYEIIRDVTQHLGLEQHLINQSESLEAEVRTRSQELVKIQTQSEQLKETLRDLQQDQMALIQTEKMATVGRLAAGLSHELNTPLGSVTSSTQTLRLLVSQLQAKGQSSTPLNEDLQAALNDMHELLELSELACKRIQKVVRSLREFTHLDRSTFEEYNLIEGLEATLALLQHQTRDRIEIQRNFEPIPKINCRPDALNQVFMNLLENSVYAIKDTGTIRIDVDKIDASQIAITIEDSGSGIPEKELEKIFDAGFTTKPRGVGTGLGLAVSQAIVRDHNGTLKVESEQGQYTRVTLTLPIEANS